MRRTYSTSLGFTPGVSVLAAIVVGCGLVSLRQLPTLGATDPPRVTLSCWGKWYLRRVVAPLTCVCTS
jgi:hypothetical protein